jgi:dynein heavy chain 2, cytosolic
MGQDQTCAALELLGQCAAQGKWLCLKNIHLVATWLLKLEHAVHSLKPAPGFRLWLTTEASETFPQGLLESCLVCFFFFFFSDALTGWFRSFFFSSCHL